MILSEAISLLCNYNFNFVCNSRTGTWDDCAVQSIGRNSNKLFYFPYQKYTEDSKLFTSLNHI
jgi:hypothetical protein